ncbi:RNA polymerase sigma factor SigF [Baekduia alba]|uniref:sigma-70 family RNA polymerase sigma factor n=1 Tax=Baekduia alba TaxID=2997333 RepID=UPI00233FE4E6|nr:sigma-70 family RNA polymerase sigma factor [Baekduia alba]WCB93482.1 RNA polymerase sigma factor SigF [Baekduia alba]
MQHPSRSDVDRLVRFARHRDPDLRRQLVERYMPLARFAAGRYAKGSEPFDDLLQVASIGLLKAIDRFDPENGAAFSSYALPTMQGELRRHFRDRSWAVRPPRDLQDHALLVERVDKELRARWRRPATVEEIADHAKLTASSVLEAREALGARHASSLSQDADEDGLAAQVERRHGIVDAGFDRVEHRATLDALTHRALTRREREIVRLRFDEDLTQSEIGAIVGLSQMHVSRVLRVAVDKLRHEAVAASAVAA